MKFLAFAAVASAVALPQPATVKEIVLDDGSHVGAYLNNALETGLDAVNGWFREALAHYEYGTEDEHDDLFADNKKNKFANYTIYQLLTGNNYTTKFAALVDQYDDLVDLLNSTAANSTLFAPVDTAFEKLPGGELNETGAALEALVRYHVGLDAFPYKTMYKTHTIPTAHNESLLGDAPQRLRSRFEKGGLRLNFYSRVIAPNFIAKNGVLHGVDTIVTPPTFVGAQLASIPFRYSTLMLAMQKTNFVQFIHGLVMNGSTVLAPSNTAFEQLSPKLNAFLFNTPKGLKYLEALLKYSIVPNATVYSDAYYGPNVSETTTSKDGHVNRTHYELPTLLKNATVSVNVTTFPGYIFMTVNTGVRVTIQDGVAKNGVIQEVSRLVFPPLLPNGTDEGAGNPWDDNVYTIADAIARLSPYVDDAAEDDGENVDVPEDWISEL